MTSVMTDQERLARLIAFPSVAGRPNHDILDFICDQIEAPGVRIHRVPAENEQRVNLVALAGPPDAPPERGLALSAHMDVVPAEEDGWESDPFTLTDRGDRWVARGAADMKGFLALAVGRFAEWSRRELAAPLALLLSTDEELGAVGAQWLVKRWNDRDAIPRACLVGEPTSLKPLRMHKGHVKIRIAIEGRPAHSGSPHLGDNAIRRAARIMERIDALNQRYAERAADYESGHISPPVVSPVRIAGGNALNVIPDRCELWLSGRPAPGMTGDQMARDVRGAIDPLADGRVACDLVHETESLLTPSDAPLFRRLVEIAGEPDQPMAPYATDAGALMALGVQSVIFGPGSIDVAHRPNEWLPKDEFVGAGEVVDRLIGERCAGGQAR
jgi:acetylornithine deacetylase